MHVLCVSNPALAAKSNKPLLLLQTDFMHSLVPECNGLSQFNEDTDKHSVPVGEFNLIACPLVQSS